MPQILVRNVEMPLKTRLQKRAKRNGRSMEAEVREILRNELTREEQVPTVGFGSASAALFSGRGVCLDEPITEWRGFPVEPIRFDAE